MMKARWDLVSGLRGMVLAMTLVMSVTTGRSVQAGGVLFVDDDAPAAGDGLSWNTAYRFLRDALNTAITGGISEIRVAQGTYLPDHSESSPTGTGIPDDFFVLTNGLTLKGGYAGLGNPDPNARDIALYETILSGDLLDDDGPLFANRNDNSYQVVFVPGVASPVVIEGLTIRSGYAIFGTRHGGFLIGNTADLTIRQCRFIDNRAWHRGGGIYYDSGSLTIEQCEFRDNFADIQNSAEGGAIFLQNSSANVTDSRFVGNYAESSGGAIYSNFTGQVTIDRCEFYSNWANRSAGGAVLHNSAGPFLLTNTILIGNFANVSSGALHIGGTGSKTVRTSTIAFNTAGRRYGGMLLSNGIASLKSCVLWGNVASESVGEAKQVLMEGLVNAVDYCCIEGLTAGFGGIGNIGDDPLFVDADGADNVIGTEDDDLHLSAGSPCIDTGDPGFVPLPGETDFDGQPRIIAGRVDMGMDEAFSLGQDCNLNGIADATDIIDGTSQDCNTNNIPDECVIADLTSLDCNSNSVP
ncbi:MAG: right-handed parallel beta-helix repeat-containing protein, partial [Planctomycetes bacterium]|nr:right-handed parallel beta-helix repeat-containing protein [Planctomycetota bacterium]